MSGRPVHKIAATVVEGGVQVEVAGVERFLSWTWLRDHAPDPSSFHPVNRQRLVPACTVEAAGPATIAITPDGLRVDWDGGPTATFTAEFLAALTEPAGVTARPGPPERPWTGGELGGRLTTVDHGALVDSDDVLRTAMTGLLCDGAVVVDDVPDDLVATRAAIERFGYARRTIFGDVWEYGADGGFDDTASTSLEIAPHTDGTYSRDAPGLLALHCRDAATSGGATILVDGAAVDRRLADAAPAAHGTLRTVDIPGQYIGDGVHLTARRPVLRHDEQGFAQVSYNHHDRAPFVLPARAMRRVYDALHTFAAAGRDPDLRHELTLGPGTMLLVDNWRVLHGRTAFRGRRAMAGGYVNREDLESTARRLGL